MPDDVHNIWSLYPKCSTSSTGSSWGDWFGGGESYGCRMGCCPFTTQLTVHVSIKKYHHYNMVPLKSNHEIMPINAQAKKQAWLWAKQTNKHCIYTCKIYQVNWIMQQSKQRGKRNVMIIEHALSKNAIITDSQKCFKREKYK